MSTYATVEGMIQFSDQAAYKKVVQILKEGGWVDSSGYWRNELGHQIGADGTDDSQMIIHIPLGYYRNLLHILDKILEGASAFSGKWASTDGMFSGGSFDSKEIIDLKKWAKEQGLANPPADNDVENLSFWMDEVIHAFITGNYHGEFADEDE